MRSTIAAVAFFSALASAQVIDPSTVPLADRTQWCVSQKAACPSLCAQQADGSTSTASNTCDPKTLDYSCVCASGLTPNATEYSQTIPYFICTEYNTQCVARCGQNSACASACREDNPCGAKNPTRVNLTSSATAAATSGGSAGTGAAATTGLDTFGGSGSGGSSSQSTGSSSSAIKMTAMSFGQTYGFVAIVGGLFAGFSLML